MRGSVFAVGLLVPAFLEMVSAQPALAHATLTASQPARGETVSGEFDVVLRFDSRVDAQRSRFTLSGPDGTSSELPARPGASPGEVAAHARPPVPGQYVLHWQVLAVDGHVSRGLLPFTVAAP